MELIDPGDPETWPEDVQVFADALLDRCREVDDNGPGTHSCDLRLEWVDARYEADREFRELLGQRPLALYHATRLLPHEMEAVRREGLLVLDLEHRARRLDQVIELYGDDIGADRLEALRGAGPLQYAGHRQGRVGILWGVTPLQLAFDCAGRGMTVFLKNWGGETFYWAAKDGRELAATIERLTELSRPTIVVAGVHAPTLCDYMLLWPVFVGRLGGWPEPWNEFSTAESVPPEEVVDLLTPGSTGWPDLGDWVGA